ncbi:MAG: nucleotidyltransferase domain-containing protein [Melioribacteraceae bacterium]|nr:nucleotidyltransferase domain-containing protein [Melioribacteraceae bacterium]
MTPSDKPFESIINELQDKTKELSCLYSIEECLNREDFSDDNAFNFIINTLPSGLRYSNFCEVKLIIETKVYTTPNFIETPWHYTVKLHEDDKTIGKLSVYYKKGVTGSDANPFLDEEIKLIKTVGDRISHFIHHRNLQSVFEELQSVKRGNELYHRGEWKIVLDMFRKTDPNLFASILRKLLHHLCWKEVEGADKLLALQTIELKVGDSKIPIDENKPMIRRKINTYDEYINAILNLADENIKDEQILAKIQKWVKEEKASGLVKAVESLDTSLSDISDAIRKYYHLAPEKFKLSAATVKGLRVTLLRRFFTEQLEYISIAKDYVKLTDFYHLIDNMIFPPGSHGKLGGKSAGLFLASHILRKSSEDCELLKDFKTPKTWYVASDALMHFMHFNDLEETIEQKYKDIDEVRLEYPHIIQLFKNSQFPPDLVKGLSVALDDFGDTPLIVRSSSLMEDQMGAAFSGKYKSLFLANQGPKETRLHALTDAIAEVYASTFGPDPIEYRAERGLIDFHEEMGIMIQEVVGSKIGPYFCPAFAGVAFSNNEFRWSSRIKREDGLVRIVPGLGTRAVDRLSDDYPILVALGQPNLRVNVSVNEQYRYSPRKIDVINLETNDFETIEMDDLLKKYGEEYPMVEKMISIMEGNIIRQPMGYDIDFESGEFIVTFDGLINKSNFIQKIYSIINTLQEKMKTPVDLEFAHDGTDLYLLQSRPQSYFDVNLSDPIPKDIPEDQMLFTANRYISNGRMSDITNIVYVEPQAYAEIPEKETMLRVGRAVGRLNKILPKRQFILMGPGRWGSRGDIKLGVSVTYSDINNTAMLVEIAKKKGNYIPDLSFGTHFFQDLVEASIQYLPLYPDDEGIFFNERFFDVTENIFTELLPEYKDLENIIKVIDVPSATNGNILKILLNADLDEAVGLLLPPTDSSGNGREISIYQNINSDANDYDQWKWRVGMVEKMASELDGRKYGVKGVYVFGSTKNASATAKSDIDLIVHVDKSVKMGLLENWFQGWSLCLSEMNYLRTGYKTDGLLDIYYVTDEDIENNDSYAAKITAVTDPAKKLELKKLL